MPDATKQPNLERPGTLVDENSGKHLDDLQVEAVIEFSADNINEVTGPKSELNKQRQYESYRRIIHCADGTWTAPDTGEKNTPSNVARIARAIANNGTIPATLDDGEVLASETGPLVKQVVFYAKGLGASDMWVQKLIKGIKNVRLDLEPNQAKPS